MAQQGAGELVNAIVSDSESLTAQEVAADGLIAILKLSALESGEKIKLVNPDAGLLVAPGREAKTSPSLFYKVAPVGAEVASRVQADGNLDAFELLSSIAELPGLRAALATRLAALKIRGESPTTEGLEEILKIRIETWRRNCLEMAARKFAARTDPKKLGLVLQGISMMTSAERVVVWHPVVLRHMELAKQDSPDGNTPE